MTVHRAGQRHDPGFGSAEEDVIEILNKREMRQPVVVPLYLDLAEAKAAAAKTQFDYLNSHRLRLPVDSVYP